jgi:hypothetical protein
VYLEITNIRRIHLGPNSEGRGQTSNLLCVRASQHTECKSYSQPLGSTSVKSVMSQLEDPCRDRGRGRRSAGR